MTPFFPDKDACKRYLVARRWPEGVSCPRCGNEKVYPVTNKPFHWQCSACAAAGGYRFSVSVGTVFENTNKPLGDWFKVSHLMLTSKKGMSALQIMRYKGFGSYKTALYMRNRIRVALSEHRPDELAGVVEVDETYIGGKARKEHWDKRDGGTGGIGSGKTIVVGAISRKGNVVLKVIDSTDTETLDNFVNEDLSNKVSLICTDEHAGYQKLGAKYKHGIVSHEAQEYVVGAIHTNTIEGFWSIIKRGVVGNFYKASGKYMPLYVAEFQFRHNNRENEDIFGSAIARW